VIADFKKFPELELERQKCLADIRSRLIKDYTPFFKNVSGIALIDVALHFNLGDTVLWRAAIHLATLFGHTVDYVCAASQESSGALRYFPHCDKYRIMSLVKNNGLVMYHAGGNWGDLYRFVQDYRLRILKILGDNYAAGNGTYKVIQLPQSIAYSSHGKTAIIKDDAAMNALPSGMFTLLARQHDSYLWAKQHYQKNISVLESPDIAFALGQLSPIGKPIMDVIFIMRGDGEDREKGIRLKQTVAERFNGTGFTYSFQDYHYANWSTEYAFRHPTITSEVRLNAVIKTISKGRLLITNRFHGHIVGMMMGRTTFWIDTIQGKLRETRSVAFRSSKHCTDKSMRSFNFPSTLAAVDAAIALLRHPLGSES